MSKFVRMIKNMSKVQKIVTLGVSTVVLCGAVIGGVILYNHSTNEAEIKAEHDKIVSEAEDMSAKELSDFLSNNAVDEETRKELEDKLDEKYSKEDQTVATKPSEDKKEETKPSDDKKEESNTGSDTKPADKPSTGGNTSDSKPVEKPAEKPSTGEGSSNTKPTEPAKPVDPPKPSRPSGYSSSVTNEFWTWIDKGMVNNTFENAENIPRIHKDMKSKLDNITAGYINKSKSASQTKSEIMNIGWTPAWSFDSSLMTRPDRVYVSTISVSGDLSAKQAGREIHNKWTNGSFEIPYNYVNCKVYYESSNNTYVAYIAAMVDKFNR
ncbi:MAG: hypothetical protein E6X34_15060 [Clostridium sp.]|uniref:hypothetical protein n=1 Tax=Clostridium sp. TaxID=1506 RepID=UPI002915A644|nr:hypothetical protein [Clostridium sp.]MDU4939762.1 hypothetical protein [Clostridium sp.]